jgi:cardiolipin synthase
VEIGPRRALAVAGAIGPRRALAVALALAALVALGACAAPSATAPVALQVLPEAGIRPLLRGIERASTSIDLEVYLLSHPEVVAGLRSARARGVRVRVLLEEHPFGGLSNAPTFAELQRAGVEARWTGPAFRLSHAKLLIVDRARAWIMTANLTRAAFQSNREYLALIADPEQVADLSALFEADWSWTAREPRAGGLVVSPSTARARIADLIAGATRTLDLEAEELVDAESVRLLGEAAARGVAVRVVMSPGANDAGRAALARAGGQLRSLARPYVHAKMILADNARLYVGSVNLTAQSLDRNREVGVILTAAPAVELARATFERDWRGAQ